MHKSGSSTFIDMPMKLMRDEALIQTSHAPHCYVVEVDEYREYRYNTKNFNFKDLHVTNIKIDMCIFVKIK